MQQTVARLSDGKNNLIPDIDWEEVYRRSLRIRTMVRWACIRTITRRSRSGKIITRETICPEGILRPVFDGRGELYNIEQKEIFHRAITAFPKPLNKATNIKPLRNIQTYHLCDDSLIFKPTIAEVLVQIPDEYLNEVVALEIMLCGRGGSDNLYRRSKSLRSGYYVFTTCLYRRA